MGDGNTMYRFDGYWVYICDSSTTHETSVIPVHSTSEVVENLEK
ncbi:MAG: hypothetical protein ACLFMM_00025 [Methanohalobium sp.]